MKYIVRKFVLEKTQCKTFTENIDGYDMKEEKRQ